MSLSGILKNYLDRLGYYTNLLSHPSYLDYIQMNLGIKARYRKNKTFWRSHLANSQRFLLKNLKGINSLLILGAGRLLDCPINALSSSIKNITLADIDPSCKKIWRSCGFSRKHPFKNYLLTDLTGVTLRWSADFQRKVSLYRRGEALSTAEKLLKLFCSSAINTPSLKPREAVASVNILSQLHLCFSDTVIETLKKCRVPREAVLNSLVPHYLSIIRRKIEQSHIRLCFSLAQKKAVFISDKVFISYTLESPEWEELEAVEWDFKPPKRLSRNWKLADSASWYWNIVPLNSEIKSEGKANLVKAAAFSKLQ